MYIDLHRKSDHTHPMVQTRWSVLKLKSFYINQMAPRRCSSNLVNIKFKEVTGELVLKESTVLHWITEGGNLFHSRTTTLLKKNLVQSEFTCLHLSFMPLFLVRKVSSIINNIDLSTLVKLSILKHSISFPRKRRFSRENMLRLNSLSS